MPRKKRNIRDRRRKGEVTPSSRTNWSRGDYPSPYSVALSYVDRENLFAAAVLEGVGPRAFAGKSIRAAIRRVVLRGTYQKTVVARARTKRSEPYPPPYAVALSKPDREALGVAARLNGIGARTFAALAIREAAHRALRKNGKSPLPRE